MFSNSRYITAYSCEISVPQGLKRNEQSQITGKGLCWAACVASMNRFYKSTRTDTAKSVVADTGNTAGITDIWELSLIYSEQPYYYNVDRCYGNAISSSTIISYIANNNPIQVGGSTSDGASKHTVICCGYNQSSVGFSLT